MTRASKRRLAGLCALFVGPLIVLRALASPETLVYPLEVVLLFGAFLACFGALGLAGADFVFRGGNLDPRFDPDAPQAEPEVYSPDRIGEQPGLGSDELWLPFRFASFPARCASCGKAATRAWPVQAKRGFELVLAHAYRLRALLVPVCTPCHRRRRTLGWLAHGLPLVALLLWMALASIALEQLSDTALGIGFVASLCGSAALVRARAPGLLDRALVGVSGRKLDADDLAGVFRFRAPELAREVSTLTRRAAVAGAAAEMARTRRA